MKTIIRRAEMTRDAWVEYAREDGAPILIERALDSVPALERWSPEYLADTAGARPVLLEQSVRPIYRPDRRIDGGRYQRTPVSFSAAVAAVAARARGPHHYISTVEVRSHLPELTPDVPLPAFLEGRRRLRGIYLFAGGAGTGSHPHYDLTENFVAVFRGRKRVLMFPPASFRAFRPLPVRHLLCNMSGLSPDPRGWLAWAHDQGVPTYECSVGAGDILFLPLHWWHFVENETLTIGVTYSFDVPVRRRASWRHLRVSLRGRLDAWNPSPSALTPPRTLRDTPRMQERPVAVSREMVPLDFVLRHARVTGQLAFARSAARAFVVAHEATRLSIQPGDEALQMAADEFRLSRGLASAEATEQWLAAEGLTVEDFEERIRGDVLERLVRDAITRDQVAGFVERSKADFETATISRIQHRDQGVVLEIKTIDADGDQDFHALARQCSEDEASAAAGGYIGTVFLSSLPEPVRQAIRTCTPGDVVGPIQNDGTWELYKVDAYAPAILTDENRERAARLLFDRWIEEKLTDLQLPL